jgi:hypothetical protein
MNFAQVATKMWDDEYFYSLSTTEKLLWIYLMTNQDRHICGIYELSIIKMQFHTGIKRDEITAMLKKFDADKKIKYEKGYIFLLNSAKHQNYNNKQSVVSSIEKGFKDIDPTLKTTSGYKIKLRLHKERLNENETVVIEKSSIPSWDEFKKYATEKADDLDLEALKNKYDAWVVNGWRTGKNSIIKNWKVTLLNTLKFLKNGSSNGNKHGIRASEGRDSSSYRKSNLNNFTKIDD